MSGASVNYSLYAACLPVYTCKGIGWGEKLSGIVI